MSAENPDKPKKNHLRSIWSFYGHGFWKAFKKSFEKYGWAILFLGLLYSVIIPFLPDSIKDQKFWSMDINYWLTYAIPGVLLFFFLAYHVFRAPYEIYKEQFEKHEKEIAHKEAEISKLAAQVEYLKAPVLEIEAVTTEIKSAKWHSCLIAIQNKSSTKTADNLRVELISLDDELKIAVQATHFHPPFPVVLNTETSGTNTLNPGGRMQYRLFRVSASNKSGIIKDGQVVGWEQKLFARFNSSDVIDHNTAAFQCQKPYRLKLAVTARDFQICEREFALIFVDDSKDLQVNIKQTLINVSD